VKRELKITVNGDLYHLLVGTNQTLLDVIRDEIGLTGTKSGCEMGECGACTVIMNGNAVNSCLILAHEADGQEIQTIEGLAQGDKLHPIQNSFVEHGAIQCGYCTSGMVMSTTALLDKNPVPDIEAIKKGLRGNLCRCTGYTKIIKAVEAARDEEEK
jgi:carbon-monoxide dehydrogenase small subunit